MAYRLIGAKPLSEPLLEYCWLDPQEQSSVKFQLKITHFHSRKCIWKCCLEKWWPFCTGLKVLNLVSRCRHSWLNPRASAMCQVCFKFPCGWNRDPTEKYKQTFYPMPMELVGDMGMALSVRMLVHPCHHRDHFVYAPASERLRNSVMPSLIGWAHITEWFLLHHTFVVSAHFPPNHWFHWLETWWLHSLWDSPGWINFWSTWIPTLICHPLWINIPSVGLFSVAISW